MKLTETELEELMRVEGIDKKTIKSIIKMNKYRAKELLVPLYRGTAENISPIWQTRLVEALEFVVEHDKEEE